MHMHMHMSHAHVHAHSHAHAHAHAHVHAHAVALQGGTRLENPAARVARVAGASADTDTDMDGQEDNLDDDEDETRESGTEDGRAPPPAGGSDMQPDAARATRHEAWDQHIVPILQRCPMS